MRITTKFDIGEEVYDIKVALTNNPMRMKIEHCEVSLNRDETKIRYHCSPVGPANAVCPKEGYPQNRLIPASKLKEIREVLK